MRLGRLALTGVLLAAAGPVHAACTMSRIADLPVTMAGLRPMVDAKVNGRPVRFLADSGAFYSLITPGTAAELGLRLEPAPSGYRITGSNGEASVSLTRIAEFTVAGQPIRGITFLVGGSEVGGGAGLLGQNFLGLRDAEYDLAGGSIRLLDMHGCARTNLAYWSNGKPFAETEIAAISRTDPHIVGTVLVNGIRMRAMFDTGAATSALTVSAAARAGVHVSDPGVVPAGFGSGIGRRAVRTWTGPFTSFAIGNEEVRNTRLRIADFGAAEFDMLVGADFFLSHHIFVANSIHRMFLTYNGGRVFNLDGAAAPAPESAETPTDADGLARRGAARAARRDYAGALADMDRAVALAPDDARLLLQRARIHLALKQPLPAANDLDRVLTLRPDDVDARMVRAGLRLGAEDKAGARADADAAAAAAPRPADAHLAIAGLYAELELPASAIAELDLWIAAHPDDARRPGALNARCWARALAGRDLSRALEDCNAALGARPGQPSFLDSRGLVRLRLHDYDRAIADYDRALAADPKQAWSLYGRGLARRAKGLAAEGAADIAAAVALRPGLPGEARRYGIAPAD